MSKTGWRVEPPTVVLERFFIQSQSHVLSFRSIEFVGVDGLEGRTANQLRTEPSGETLRAVAKVVVAVFGMFDQPRCQERADKWTVGGYSKQPLALQNIGSLECGPETEKNIVEGSPVAKGTG
jgi:hypothetical protein